LDEEQRREIEKDGIEVSREADDSMDNKEDSDDLLPEPDRLIKDDSVGTPAPRTARFGEGAEGKGMRKERGVTGARAGFFTRTSQFLSDVRAEMRRVSWPTLNDVRNTTIIVLVAVIFFAIYLFLVDRGIAFLITQTVNLLGWLAGKLMGGV
jgi:preprotein translocase subunit SecE